MVDYALDSFPCRILLIVPYSGSDSFFYRTPHLGLGYVGSSIKSYGHDVKLLDLSLSGDWSADTRRTIEEFRPHVVGITGFSYQYVSVLEIAALAKKARPEAIIVYGGPHASALSEYIIGNEQNIDFVLTGEAERSFPLLLKALFQKENLRSIPGLTYREAAIARNAVSPVEDLDLLPYPWHVMNPLDYQHHRVHGFVCRRLPLAQVISSRGCPYLCSFCAGGTVLGKKIRMRDPVSFVDELHYLKENFGINEIQIVDDNFTFYREHAMTVCAEIVKRNLNISWSLPNGVRADRLDKALLGAMKTAGCYYLAFGIEFGSPRILDIVHKSLDLEKARQNIILAKNMGFITQGFFLIGHPQETEEDIRKTEAFITATPFDKVLLNMPFPYPGTELFDYYMEKRYKRVEAIDWKNFREAGFSYLPGRAGLGYVNKKRKSIFLKFYLNPAAIIRFISKIKTFEQLKTAWYGFGVLLKCFTRKR